MVDKSVSEFLENLSGKSATPGGGSVAALNGAMGAALITMVCNLTIGKQKYAAVEPEIKSILRESESLRARLTTMITEDTDAFNGVMAAFALPKQTEKEKITRSTAIQDALKQATLVPLETARACAQVIALGKPVVEMGNINSLSDAGSGVHAAYAGLRSAALNVSINLGGIKDSAFTSKTEAELNEIMSGQAELVEEIYALVKSAL